MVALVPGVLARAKCPLWIEAWAWSYSSTYVSGLPPPCLSPTLPTPPASPSVVFLSQGKEHSLGCVLEEGSSVLLLSLLHPVAVHSESVGVDESAQRPESIGVTDDDLPGHRLHPAVLVIDPH